MTETDSIPKAAPAQAETAEVDPDSAEPPFPEAPVFGPTVGRWFTNGWLETALFTAVAVNPHSP